MVEPTTATHPEQHELLTSEQVAHRYGTSSRSIDRWVSDGQFPAPIRAARIRRWALRHLIAWEDSFVVNGTETRDA